MGTTHDLKTWPEFFGAILDGRKTFEVRDTRDRDFAVGDTLRLREWTPSDGCRPGSYTGREATRTVSYIVRGAPFLPSDLAVLGLIDDADGSSAEHWRAQYVKQVNLRHERNKESDARLAAVTAERDAALARAERWKRAYEELRVDFVALAEEKMTLRAQVESALGGKPVEDPVSDAVILAQRVAQEREVAVRDGDAIRKAIGLDADASTTSVLARLAETHPDLLASGERATFLRRSGAEMAKREMVLLCRNRCQAETDPEKVNVLRATFSAMASLDLGAFEDLATLPSADCSILHDAAVIDVLRLRSELEAMTAERDRLQRACDEGLPREYIECPACGKQHIEGPRHDNPALDGRTRPHHTHRCYHCGHVWPSGRWSFGADVPKPADALGAARSDKHYRPVQVVAGVAVRDGRVLLIRSKRHGVATPGGKVRIGEAHADALRRELREETGLEVVRVGRYLHTDVQPAFQCHLYAVEVSEGEPVAGDDAEAAWWGDPAEILASSIPRDYPLVLDVIRSGIGTHGGDPWFAAALDAARRTMRSTCVAFCQGRAAYLDDTASDEVDRGRFYEARDIADALAILPLNTLEGMT